MNQRLHPVSLLGQGPEGLPLAGSRFVRFTHVSDPERALIAAAALSPADQERFCALRPDLSGLALDRPRVMGILNVTPDSFSDGGDLATVAASVARAQAMVADGADILDIGGESTRPGAAEVAARDEISRTVPVIKAIREAGITTPISIDTRKAAVAAAALLAGADMVNDVSALGFDPDLADVVAQAGVPLCLMHAKGDPATMQQDPKYDDVLGEVYDYLGARVEFACAAGINKSRLILDPGIGFGKTQAHNLALLSGLGLLHGLGLPLLLGASRKKFIGAIGMAEAPKDRMPGSVAVALHGAAMGAQILRVHDVAATRQALALWMAIAAA